jgi:uncharacterized protein (DUF1697 family)
MQIALLRAVNVGGTKMVGMAALRDLLGALGFSDVRSLLQSGNLVFRAPRRSSPALECMLEAAAAKELGLRTDFFVRSADQWQAIVAGNPFRDEADRDPSHLMVMTLKSAPAPAQYDALRSAITGPERIHGGGTHAYITYPAGIGSSRLTNAVIERHLQVRGTARNWNTVLKLAALIAP